ncbi:MAG: hypothetical protein Q4B54_01010, partial [Coriobacteriales bacterium]|nr:hypothetical protein [Coriobacteriales bacterium]
AAVATLEDRRRRIDAEISRRAASPELLPVVTSLSGIRGVSTLTAFAVECGDLLCFRDARVHVLRRPRAVGVVERRVDLEGALTKTGNAHVRRLLVEAAWHHERPLNASSRAQARSVVR